MVEMPERVGRYRVEGVIGTGGYATVYRAVDERLDASVAVKVLAENHSFDPDIRERFLQEGRVLRHIGSPHVVAVHDLGETERGQPYLVLDHADRGDLSERVAARRAAGWRPQPADVLAAAAALADALTAVHARDIVHRDLAPKNILLRSAGVASGPACELLAADEQLVLADLGLSKDLATASGLTVAGGTAGFAPPEQRDGPTRVDHRADLWSASAVLVWLLRGAPPDDAERWTSELGSIPWASSLAPVLAVGLAADPARRPADAAGWLTMIRAALPIDDVTPPLRSEPVTTVVADPATAIGGRLVTATMPPPAPPEPARSRSRWRGVVAVGVAMLVVGAVLGAVGWRLVDNDGGGGGDDGGAREQVEQGDEADGPLTRQRVETLDGGRVKVTSTAGSGEISVTGPSEVEVGEPATFEASTSVDPETRIAFWVGPDGVGHGSASTVDVTPSEVGPAVVRLYGADERGNVIEVRFEFTGVEP